jgi:hypothetical protein
VILDPDYARIYTQARVIAWNYGYTCAAIGSYTRDLDLLLVPWEDRAIENHDQLLKLIAQSCGLRFRDGQEDILKSKPDYTIKPHGRKSCSLFFSGPYDRRWVDIGIMPCAAKAEPVAWLHTVAQHGGEGEQDKALSFAPENFPLQGEEVGMFYSIGQPEPLYLRPHGIGVPACPGQTFPLADADAAAKKDAFDEMEGK